ncbi:MAG: 16S rRNA (uracil(1498)-N(3))-methyltransferase [Chitinophagaceae bacterium]|nr:16S rRNA (uracil(1498)-N(3))-methyltransferase [Chitinophagaceae bacterium]
MELYLASKIENEQIFLGEEESHHCIQVMRHHAGDLLEVTDGRGKKLTASVINENRRACVLEVVEVIETVPGSNTHVHLAIAPTKNMDRFEWMLEKATEIGIDEITPIVCQRSERSQIKSDRLNKLLVAAMKQSLRCWLPVLHQPIKFADFLSNNASIYTDDQENFKAIFHCQQKGLPLLKQIFQPKKKVLLLIGPEGDFTMEEIRLAEEKGFQALSLGNARLRTETAGIVAIHTIQLLSN